MQEVTVHDAKTHLSRLLKAVEQGEEILIKRGSKPVARLVPVEVEQTRVWGQYAGQIRIAEDFDAPLPPEVQRFFE